MPVYFVDSSALVKRYRHETGSDRLNDLLNRADVVIVARLALVEVSAAIVRRARATGVTTAELERILEVVDREVRDSFDVVELDETVMAGAVALARRHGLRAADAMQLACAIQAREGSAQDFSILTSDAELNVAAEAEGFAVVDPTRP